MENSPAGEFSEQGILRVGNSSAQRFESDVFGLQKPADGTVPQTVGVFVHGKAFHGDSGQESGFSLPVADGQYKK